MIGNDDYREFLSVAATRKYDVILSSDDKQWSLVGECSSICKSLHMVVAISISITSRGNHESDVNPFAMASQKVLLGVGLLSLG